MGAANTIAVGTKAVRAGDDTDRYYGTSTSQSSTWFGHTALSIPVNRMYMERACCTTPTVL